MRLLGLLVVASLAFSAGGCSAAAPPALLPSATRPAGTSHGFSVLRGITVPLATDGGTFKLPSGGNFTGLVAYNGNDAPSGATLRVTNYGTTAPPGAPKPPSGSPVLYVQALLAHAAQVTFQSGGSNTMMLVSNSLQTTATYAVYVYSGSRLVNSLSARPLAGRLTVATPFAGLTLTSGSLLFIEVVPYVDWQSFGFDLQRTGYNPLESAIGPRNVRAVQKLWTADVGSAMVHEPVYAYGVNVSGHPTNILYAGSAYGSAMYALDASTGRTIWKDPVPFATYSCGHGSSKFSIGETPAIDRARNRIYFADGENFVHAVDLATGAEASGWPLQIADYTPDHNFMHGGFTYNPSNGLLYAVTGSTCDISPWYGRIVAISVSGPSVAGTFYPMSGTSTQGASGGGVWGPGGASIDPRTNNVFFATGNADTSMGAQQNASFAEQVIELTPNLGGIVANNYPTNIPIISGDDDFDFGATPMLFQPPGCPPLLGVENKSGMFELYDRPTISTGPVQYIAMSIPTDAGDFIGTPAYDPITGYVYVGMPAAEGIYQAGLAAFAMQSNCTLNPTPVWNASFPPDGNMTRGSTQRSPISIANGVVYVSNFSANTEFAFDAATGALLWSVALPSFGNVGTVVANGVLYVSAGDGTITAWSLGSKTHAKHRHHKRLPR